MADGSVVESCREVKIPVVVGDSTMVEMVLSCRVVPTLSNEVVLGMDWL